MREWLRPVAAVLAPVLLITGCHRWSPVEGFATSLNAQPPSSVRVRMLDGRQFEIRQPRVVGDSLVGQLQTLERPDIAVGPRRMAVAVAQVRSVEAGRLDRGRTALMALGLLAGSLTIHSATCAPSNLTC